MIYKNIEIHNVAELIPCEEGGVRWLRMPTNVLESLESGDQGQRMTKNATGVELRFVIKGDEAVIRMQSLADDAVVSHFHVFRGGIQGGWDDHEVGKRITGEVKDFVIKKSQNMDVLKSITKDYGIEWDPEVVRVVIDRGSCRIIDVLGDVEPPQKEQMPKKTMLAYGSSITHGSNALSASNSWVSIVAHKLNMDYRNLGMAGSCCMEPEMIDYIASEGEKGNWDLAVLELGINVLGWKEEKIRERVENTIKQIAGRNAGKRVVVISPFYSFDDYKKEGKSEIWRRIIPEIIEKLAYKNVTYIDGLELLGDMSLISADEVHPNIYGVAQIADRLYNRLK